MSSERSRDAVDRLIRDALGARDGTGIGTCPDAELLAAFAEQRLPTGERAALEQHLARCADCQQVLTILAHDDASTAVAEKAEPSRPLAWVWRWLAPAAAVAGMVILYVALKPATLDQAATAPEPAQVVAQRSPDATPDTERLRDAAATSEMKSGTGAAAVNGRRGERLDARAESEPTAAAQRPENARTLEVAAPEPPPPAPAARIQPGSPPAGVAGAPPAPVMAAAAERPVPEEKTVVAADEAAKPKAGMRREAVFAAASATESLLLTSPDAQTLWRIDSRSILLKSTDGGRTWRVQHSDPSHALTAGTAVSASVCWVVGRAGIVLVTTDGEQWVARPLPDPVDLVSIEAQSAMVATVTAADGRTFATNDGGHSWVGR